jgi:hypothetical protein
VAAMPFVNLGFEPTQIAHDVSFAKKME